MFLYNQARNEKFLELAQDFIDEIMEDDEEEADEEKAEWCAV